MLQMLTISSKAADRKGLCVFFFKHHEYDSTVYAVYCTPTLTVMSDPLLALCTKSNLIAILACITVFYIHCQVTTLSHNSKIYMLNRVHTDVI